MAVLNPFSKKRGIKTKESSINVTNEITKPTITSLKKRPVVNFGLASFSTFLIGFGMKNPKYTKIAKIKIRPAMRYCLYGSNARAE